MAVLFSHKEKEVDDHRMVPNALDGLFLTSSRDPSSLWPAYKGLVVFYEQ